ncbi:hypothetical protein N658DRAFT_351854 [Parathielavia hyrcaniae]|uniref:Uncharacterized protein n=1 Tax=Parathielavia hyrcaniae TaxID=113614 RepID=A0AAN6Q265_9PEZI|nr:hypothetical protein N658DRAFT_351854 [Parathielavia hyrcaniae]
MKLIDFSSRTWEPAIPRALRVPVRNKTLNAVSHAQFRKDKHCTDTCYLQRSVNYTNPTIISKQRLAVDIRGMCAKLPSSPSYQSRPQVMRERQKGTVTTVKEPAQPRNHNPPPSLPDYRRSHPVEQVANTKMPEIVISLQKSNRRNKIKRGNPKKTVNPIPKPEVQRLIRKIVPSV